MNRLKMVEQNEKLLAELKELWRRYPHLRFGQLIENLRQVVNPEISTFYLEDSQFLFAIQRINARGEW